VGDTTKLIRQQFVGVRTPVQGRRGGGEEEKEKKRQPKQIFTLPLQNPIYNPIVTKCRAFLGSALDQDFTFVF